MQELNHIYTVSYYTQTGEKKERDTIADSASDAIAFIKSYEKDFDKLIVCQRIKD